MALLIPACRCRGDDVHGKPLIPHRPDSVRPPTSRRVHRSPWRRRSGGDLLVGRIPQAPPNRRALREGRAPSETPDKWASSAALSCNRIRPPSSEPPPMAPSWMASDVRLCRPRRFGGVTSSDAPGSHADTARGRSRQRPARENPTAVGAASRLKLQLARSEAAHVERRERNGVALLVNDTQSFGPEPS